MKWYHYIAAFFAGAFLCNAIPHFVSGVTGHPFPSPFATPPGEGLSSPIMNVLWGGINLIIGYALLLASRMTARSWAALAVFAVAFMAMGFMLADHMGQVMKP